MRAITALSALLLATSCAPDDPLPDPPPLVWSDAPESSKWAQIEADVGSSIYVRCWPSSGAGWTCLSLVAYSGFRALDRFTSASLPLADEARQSGDGYGCQDYGLSQITEDVSRDGATLTSNVISPWGERWSQRFVAAYLRDNGVGGSPYFDCVGVMRQIQKGSNVTLGTTSVTKAMLR